jgi:hypothetical protein
MIFHKKIPNIWKMGRTILIHKVEFLRRFHIKELFWDNNTGGAKNEAVSEL